MADPGITPEQLAEQIRKLRIEDILTTTITTLGQLAYAKLEARELDQARLAIDSIAALLGPLESAVESDTLRDFNRLLANVRLAYADRAAEASGSEPQTPSSPEPGPSEGGGDAAGGDEGPAEASRASVSGSEPQSPDDDDGVA